ncbi:MAG: hypothetical protein ABFD44_04530 [Anaerolineaceae bacterium]
MPDDPSLDRVYAYVEEAYLHKQVGVVLASCMEATSPAPLYEWVQALFLAGPQSLRVMQHILDETHSRKQQVMNDLMQVWDGFVRNLESCGISLGNSITPGRITGMRVNGFRSLLRDQWITDQEVEKTCLRLFRDTRDLVRSLGKHIELLDEIENYLADWMLGLFYASTHEQSKGKSAGQNLVM